MNELGTTIVKTKPAIPTFMALIFLSKAETGHLKINSIVTRESIPLFYMESANQNPIAICLLWRMLTCIANCQSLICLTVKRSQTKQFQTLTNIIK